MSRNLVINIRGTGGAGKTFLVRSFMKKFGAQPIRKKIKSDLLDIGGKVVAYRVNYKGRKVYILGSYESLNGGCDQYKGGAVEACKYVKRYHRKGDVIFEGLVISGVSQRFIELSREVGGMVWCPLSTTLDKCIERMTKRQAAARKTKKFSMVHLRRKYLAVASSIRNAIAAGETVVELDHRDGLSQLCEILDRKGTPTRRPIVLKEARRAIREKRYLDIQ